VVTSAGIPLAVAIIVNGDIVIETAKTFCD
jgi:hypothetical protein